MTIKDTIDMQVRMLSSLMKEKRCIVTSFDIDDEHNFTLVFESLDEVGKEDIKSITE